MKKKLNPFQFLFKGNKGALVVDFFLLTIFAYPPAAPLWLHNRRRRRMVRGIKDSEEGHFRSVMSEWIQLSFTSSPPQICSLLVSVPLPPGSRPVHGRTGWRTYRQGWMDDGWMERGASRAKTADKSEKGSGSSSEVATASPPGPKREQRRDKTLALCSIDLTDYNNIK